MKQTIKQLSMIAGCCLVIFMTAGCKKYLDEKPDKKLAVPSTLADLQALLDYYPSLTIQEPVADEASADNYYLTTPTWQGLSEGERRLYTWEKDNLYDSYYNDWFLIYQKVYYCNTVLSYLASIDRTSGNQVQWDFIKGQALFIRSRAYFQATVTFALVFNELTADTDPGIPLRDNPDFTQTSFRPSVRQTFDAILNDLKLAIPLLPSSQALVSRSSRPAAYALIARAYLYMGNYSDALKYSDTALQLKGSLLDFNDLDTTSASPLPTYADNPEISFYATGFSNHLYYGFIDSTLYNLFDPNDLRKKIYFTDNGDNTYSFKGSYDGPYGSQFLGIANDEVYLMRAECYARVGNTSDAMKDLNKLLINRSIKGSFVADTASDPEDALSKILIERRKEMIFRFVRWMDIKRLNRETNSITLKRVVNGQTYLLAPNDLRFALPIPEDVITLSGMHQNAR